MKKLVLILAATLCAAGIFGGASAFAESGETFYPENSDFIKQIEFTQITDYAVSGNTFVFAENEGTGSKLTIYDGETVSYKSVEQKITALHVFEGGFCYIDADSAAYLLDGTPQSVTVSESEYIKCGDFFYVPHDNELKIIDLAQNTITTLDSGYTNLKIYGDKVYSVKDNTMYLFNGATPAPLTFDYFDFTATSNLSVGKTKLNLINYSLKFIKLKAGMYATEIDLTALDGEYFSVKETHAKDTDVTALMLCTTGNATIFSVGEKCYITNSSNVVELSENFVTESSFLNATVTGNRIYASPYVAQNTSVLYPAAGTIVKILGRVEAEGVLDSAYYLVEYTKDGSAYKGYVAEGFLTEYIIEDNKKPTHITDPEYKEDSNVKVVLLVLLVVLLVLCAVGYLVYVGTKDKKKNKKNKEEKN